MVLITYSKVLFRGPVELRTSFMSVESSPSIQVTNYIEITEEYQYALNLALKFGEGLMEDRIKRSKEYLLDPFSSINHLILFCSLSSL